MTTTPITAIRHGTALTRITVGVVLTTFLALILSPTAAAARETIQKPSKLIGKPARAAPQPDKLNDTLRQAKAALARGDAKGLAQLKAHLVEADKEVMAAFATDLAHIRKHKLPDVIEQRQAAAVASYQEKHKQMLAHLDAIAAATGPAAVKAKMKAASEWLSQQQLDRTPAPFDPNKLGFMVETKKARAPKLTAKELKQVAPLKLSSFKADSSFEVAYVGSTAGLLAASAVTPPGPEYLAPTIDVQITPEVQVLTAQLHHNPVEIYNWVRNNVEWIPTYGSVQGSALTLDKKAGNAFDIASLLIAMLRASNIPARYVYGTIQVPIDKAMNWAGGFTHPDAAQTFLATGGIPNNALTSGGVTKYLRMEHVWVEAFVDFYPSRGAKNFAPDTWVPMDASYKQYAYTEGLDLQAGVPFDAEGFLASAQDGATVNEQEGWVQNLNQANIQGRLAQYQQQLEEFIESQKPDATVGEVLGGKNIQQINAPVLAASLPYQLIATGNRYAALPDGLRHKFQYSLYASSYERSIENPLWTYVEATPNLASKKVTLSFVPASDADRQTIESYLPKPHEDGSPIQPEEFPSSLPAYNIRVTAELRVEGSVVARGGTFTLGTELVGEGGFTYLHNLGAWDLTQEQHVAGQTSALGMSLQGISRAQLTSLHAHLASVSEKLNVKDYSGLSPDNTVGSMATAAAWSYFASSEAFGRSAQNQANVVDSPALSYGFIHIESVPEYRYGVVHWARFPGIRLDIGHVRRVAFEKGNSLGAWANYNRMRGQYASALEHIIPERVFGLGAQDSNAEAISAVKLLGAAAQEGQRTFKLTQANASQISNLQQPASVIDAVRNAVAAGKEVTIHQRPVTYAGFTSAGFVVLDPETGAGSYLIEGGANGGAKILLVALLFAELVMLALLTENFIGAALIAANFVTTFDKIRRICRDNSLSDEQVVSQVNNLINIALAQAIVTLLTPYALSLNLGVAANMVMVSINLFLIRLVFL